MEVVSYGHIKPRQAFCSGCGATLRYLPKDIKTKPSRPDRPYVNCPVCGKAIFTNVLAKYNAGGYLVFDESEDA